MTTRVGAALDSDVAAAEGFWDSGVDALWLTNGTLDKGNEDGQVRRRWLSRQGQARLAQAGLETAPWQSLAGSHHATTAGFAAMSAILPTRIQHGQSPCVFLQLSPS